MPLLAELIGESLQMVALRERVGHLLRRADGRRPPAVLIEGETGTGKGLLARELHRASPRRAGPFVDVNCAAIPETLFEAELFGFERGAFTDARHGKAGLFEAAHHGTLFLDEVGLLPERLQAKLLNAIEEHSVRRLGSTRSEPVDVWIIAASNQDMVAATRARLFREDLYHRLAVLTLALPPLRERADDVVLLAERFLSRACADYALPVKTLNADARAALRAYRWPGNVRELSNVIERTALLSEAPRLTADSLRLPDPPPSDPPGARDAAEEGAETGAASLADAVGRLERTRVLEALRGTRWNVSWAARRLGISRDQLRYRLDKYGLRGPGAAGAPRRRSGAPASGTPAVRPAEFPAPSGIRWERRRLAFLRATVIGSPTTGSPPDASRTLVDLIEKIRSFDGRIQDVGPGAVVAAFGLEPVEDAPRRAALAAMAVRTAVERARDDAGPALVVKLAIHAVQLPVSRVDDGLQVELDGKRSVWDTLAALTDAAVPGEIVLTEPMAPLLERRFELIADDTRNSASGRIYRLVGGERLGFGLGGRLTAFVGRQDELELLESRLGLAQMGRGAAVAIVGDAGIGKSRLLFEFRQRLRAGRVAYLEGHCLSYATTTPYLPMREILRGRCAITEADGPAAISAKVHRALAELGPPIAEEPALLLHLLDGSGGLPIALAPEVVRTRTHDTLREVLIRNSRVRPTIVVVEDLHWMDASSAEFLASLVDGLASAPMLLLVTYRPGYRPRWLDKSYVSQIALPPLSTEQSLTVLRSALHAESVSDSLAQATLAKAEGNPFFIEEMARVARDRAEPATSLGAPDTIEGVLAARIDRLPPVARRLLQTASVIGRDVPLALFDAVADTPPDERDRGLEHLKATEFLDEMRLAPDREYRFKHALTHETAYASLAAADRRDLHRRILGAMERRSADRLAEQVEQLAHHAVRGELWEKALVYLRQAGTQAAARSANREAATCFEQALVTLGHLSRNHATLEAEIDIRIDLRHCVLQLGEVARAGRYVREAAPLAELLGDRRRIGLIAAYGAGPRLAEGGLDDAIPSGERALAIAADLGDVDLQVVATHFLGLACLSTGEYRRASEFFGRNVDALGGDRMREQCGFHSLPAVLARAWLALALAERGDFAEGRARGEEGVRIAAALDHPFSLIVAHFGVGVLELSQGNLDPAIPALERGLELCRTYGIEMYVHSVASSLGWAYSLSGRVTEALPLLERILEQDTPTGVAWYRSRCEARLAETYLQLGRVDAARDLAAHALERARARRERGHEAWGLRLLGEIAARGDLPERPRAEGHYRQAIALAEALSMRPLVAHGHLGLGRLYGQAADGARARVHLTQALSLFRGMDMGIWAAQAEAALAERR